MIFGQLEVEDLFEGVGTSSTVKVRWVLNVKKNGNWKRLRVCNNRKWNS
jgi:hypothetical protein